MNRENVSLTGPIRDRRLTHFQSFHFDNLQIPSLTKPPTGQNCFFFFYFGFMDIFANQIEMINTPPGKMRTHARTEFCILICGFYGCCHVKNSFFME